MERELAKNKLKELVEQFQSASKNRDYVNEQNEEWVKWNYIEPLLEILGWKRGDIEKEYRVLKGRADYLLKIGNAEVLVVEAKKVGVPLSEEEGQELRKLSDERNVLLGQVREDMERLKNGEYKERLEQAGEEYNRLATDEREMAAMQNIARYDQQALASGQLLGNVAVVYGAAHDFSKQLVRWSAVNPQGYQRGLIKITPQVVVDYLRRTESQK